jgi:hypothetical protein
MNGRRSAWTLWMGLALIALCEAMLWIDVQRRGGLIVPGDALPAELPTPTDALGWAARWFAVNTTALCWIGYLFAADGLLVLLSRWRDRPDIASIRVRPNRFVVAWLSSIPVWCAFDAINFYGMDAWTYHGLPEAFHQRVMGYFVAFAAITPGMFLAAQVWINVRDPARSRRSDTPDRKPPGVRLAWGMVLGPWAIITATVLALLAVHEDASMREPVSLVGAAMLLAGPAVAALFRRQSLRTVSFAIGLGFLLWTVLVRDPVANFTLWTGVIYLLDPVNAAAGAPSLLRDWQAGRLARTLALFAGGLTCGLLWEFWNYWAIAKWTYDLPFLGSLENVRYFEMPLPGMLGFLPFAAECWVMTNTVVLVIERAGLRVAEPLPDARSIM